MDRNDRELMLRIVIDEIGADLSFMGLERKPQETYISIARKLNEPMTNENVLRYKDMLWKRHSIRKIKNQGSWFMRVDLSKRPPEYRTVKHAKK